MPNVQNALNVSEVQNGYVDTFNIGGDRFSFLPKSMFQPLSFFGTTSPAPLALLSAPPTYDSAPLGGVNRSPTMMGPGYSGASNPWSARESIVPWVLGGLILGWLGVHMLYYRKRK